MRGWLEALGDRLAGADFVIRHRPGRRATSIRGRVPVSCHDAVRAFFERDLGASASSSGMGVIRVRGRFGSDGRLALDIAGGLDAGRRQRVRNFLLATLG